ncbi:M23 family metallopeptidase [Clostridium polynesiense]|uniref:M23 family metallopeptidase n=1 Tax=Clostridium polynesiense TaxID=1325933 RepID=UPI000693D74E|nr:M23 family metallopeptidase [Clostridium polynesiense]
MKYKAWKKERLKKSIMLLLAFLMPYASVYYSDFIDLLHNKPNTAGIKVFASTLGSRPQGNYGSDVLAINNEFSKERNNTANKFKILMNYKLKTMKIIINNKDAAVLYNKEEADRLINNFKAYYLEKAKVDRESIARLELKGNIEFKEYYCYEWELDTMEGALNKLLAASKNDNLNLEIDTLEKYTEEISPKVTIKSSNELNVGESKTQQGENGSKEIEKKTLYINDKKVKEIIIKETITKQPKETIILQGSRLTEEKLSAVLAKPSRGSVTSFYGMRWGKMHKGTDFAGKIGDPITAALDGRVKEARFEPTYGNMVILSHGNGIETLYGHCSSLKVKEGQRVNKGDIIAEVGNTGRSTGPHLHFEVRINGIAKDSLKYIK